MISRVKATQGQGVPPPRRVISKENEGDVYLFIHGIDSAHSQSMPNYDIEYAHFSIIIDIAGESHGEIVSGYEIYIGICDNQTPTARFFFPKWTRRICRRGLEVRCLGKIPGIPPNDQVGSYDDLVFTWKQGMDKHACQVYQRLVSESDRTPSISSISPPPSLSVSPPTNVPLVRSTSSSSSSSSTSSSSAPKGGSKLNISVPSSPNPLKLSSGSIPSFSNNNNTNNNNHVITSISSPIPQPPPLPSPTMTARAWSSRLNSQQFAKSIALSLGLIWPVDIPMASNDQVPAMFDKDMLNYSIPKKFHETKADSCVIS